MPSGHMTPQRRPRSTRFEANITARGLLPSINVETHQHIHQTVGSDNLTTGVTLSRFRALIRIFVGMGLSMPDSMHFGEFFGGLGARGADSLNSFHGYT